MRFAFTVLANTELISTRVTKSKSPRNLNTNTYKKKRDVIHNTQNKNCTTFSRQRLTVCTVPLCICGCVCVYIIFIGLIQKKQRYFLIY